MKQKSIILFLCLMVALGGRAQTSTKEVTLKTTAGELDYTIEPEFRLPNIRHRRGAVGMAREDDMDDNGMSRYMENNDEEGWD